MPVGVCTQNLGWRWGAGGGGEGGGGWGQLWTAGFLTRKIPTMYSLRYMAGLAG